MGSRSPYRRTCSVDAWADRSTDDTSGVRRHPTSVPMWKTITRTPQRSSWLCEPCSAGEPIRLNNPLNPHEMCP
jgi:hypothetical protein